MAATALDLLPPIDETETPFENVGLGEESFRRELRAHLEEPLVVHRQNLGRAWFTPLDWAHVQEEARLVQDGYSIYANDPTALYREANRFASEIARELFPNFPDHR